MSYFSFLSFTDKKNSSPAVAEDELSLVVPLLFTYLSQDKPHLVLSDHTAITGGTCRSLKEILSVRCSEAIFHLSITSFLSAGLPRERSLESIHKCTLFVMAFFYVTNVSIGILQSQPIFLFSFSRHIFLINSRLTRHLPHQVLLLPGYLLDNARTDTCGKMQ